MKMIKRFFAVLLSVVFIMALVPNSAFADDIPAQLTCDYGDGDISVFKYCTELHLGVNPFLNIEQNELYFCSFVPEKTGVYNFDGGFEGITADTNDGSCLAEEFEETLYLFSEDERYGAYSELTAGKQYFVLLNFMDNFEVNYMGAVTDVKPAKDLNELVNGYDICIDDSVIDLFEELEIVFSTGSAFDYSAHFETGSYTDKTLVWSHLGFEKVLSYSVIDIRDMIASVETRDSVSFIRYFDGRIELKKPAVVVVNFKNGESTEVRVDNYDLSYDFIGTNGRDYHLSFFIVEGDSFSIWIANNSFENSNYTIKSAGFFKNFAYYLLLRSSIRTWYFGLILDEESFTNKFSLLKECSKEMVELRREFFKSVFSK